MFTVGILYPAVCCRIHVLFAAAHAWDDICVMRGLSAVVRSYCMGNAKASARGMGNRRIPRFFLKVN